MKKSELDKKFLFEKVDLMPSSNILSVKYDPNNKVALVTFRSQISYLYYNIEPQLIANWKLADSVGKFFAEYVKWGRYEQIEEDK